MMFVSFNGGTESVNSNIYRSPEFTSVKVRFVFLCALFCGPVVCLFDYILLAIVLYILRFIYSDYHFGIFKLFPCIKKCI